MILISIGLLLVVGGFTAFNMYEANKLEVEIAGLKNYLESQEVVKKSKEVKEKKRKMEVMNKYYNIVEEMNMDMDNIDIIGSDFMEKISSTIPKNLFIKTISITIEEAEMQGVADSRVPIAEFEHNLKGLDLFKNVHVSIINKEGEESSNYIFAIRCTLKDVNNYEID
jgi:type IV pilus assembly protein PilN